MSNLNSLPSTSGKANSSSPYMSLADILKAKSKSGMRTRSSDKHQLQLDLQKNLDGFQGAGSKLNFSRAFNSGAESFNFVDTAAIAERNSQLEAESARHESTQLNSHLLNQKSTRTNRRQDGRHLKKEDRSSINTSLSSFSEDPKVQIEKLINRIDNKDAQFDFDDKNKNGFSSIKSPSFNLLQLPKDFSLERARVNLYRSGVIEVVSNDCPRKVYRFKPTIHNINNVYTDLVFTTENQVYLDQMNVCSPETLKEKS